jgi:hypothetical protein
VSRRGALAVAILLSWGIGIGLLVRREYFGDGQARVARAALLIGPGATFYTVERDGRTVGYASSTIDTVDTGLRINDQLVVHPAGPEGARLAVRGEARLTRLLSPIDFTLDVEDPSTPTSVRGVAGGDSLLTLTVQRAGSNATPEQLRTSTGALPPTAVPLMVVAREQRRVGGRLAVTVFDPLTMSPRDVVLRVAAESLFTVSDSAALDGNRWTSALQDTVRAWHVVPEGDSGGISGWVDAQGRYVEVTFPGGFLLRRTTYEESAENWRRAGLAIAGRAPAGRAPADSSAPR